MNHGIFGAALTFVGGAAIAYVNYLLSRTVLRKKPDFVAATAVVRQVLNVVYLAALYFLSPYTPWGLVPLLIGAALGITLPMFYFTALLLREGGTDKKSTKPTNPSHTKGDE